MKAVKLLLGVLFLGGMIIAGKKYSHVSEFLAPAKTVVGPKGKPEGLVDPLEAMIAQVLHGDERHRRSAEPAPEPVKNPIIPLADGRGFTSAGQEDCVWEEVKVGKISHWGKRCKARRDSVLHQELARGMAQMDSGKSK